MRSCDKVCTAVSHTAVAENEVGEQTELKPYGKFKDAKSLLKAYESLESEFTRRSQRLKTIEGELAKKSQTEKLEQVEGKDISLADFIGRYPLSGKYQKEILEELNGEISSGIEKAYIKTLERKLGEVENNLSEKEQKVGKEFSDGVIKEYLKGVMQSKVKTVNLTGVALTAPPIKPKSIADASAIAKNYIKRKGE